MIKSEIIAVGTELLMGQVVNTNATTIAQFLNRLNIGVYYQTVVGDNMNRLTEQLTLSASRSDLIVLCGGIGPTQDDVTKFALAQFLNQELVQHPESFKKITDYYAKTQREMAENNLRQSLILEKATPLFNHNGFATGMVVEQNGVTYVVLPGPPSELTVMLDKEVLPLLQKKSEQVLVSKLLRFTDIGESLLASQIDDLVTQQTNPTIAIYAKPGLVDVRVTASGNSYEEARERLTSVTLTIQKRLVDYYYGSDEDSLESVVFNLLKQKHWTIGLAESVTGGMVANALTSLSGISEVFVGGVVSYHNRIKEEVLGVRPETLATYGAISKECALEMAKGVRKQLQTDVALSFTGIADATTLEDKPSGLVYIGVVTPTQEKVIEIQLHRDRNFNRQLAMQKGLFALRNSILED